MIQAGGHSIGVESALCIYLGFALSLFLCGLLFCQWVLGRRDS